MMGYTKDIAWGLTTGFIDCYDLFIEKIKGDEYQTQSGLKQISSRTETIGIKDQSSKEIEIKKEYRNENLKVIMATRLINDKGVFDYLELAKLMKDSSFEFYLAGDVDEGNPDSLSNADLVKIRNNNFINYLGHIDVNKELCNYDINIVMSKYEGSSRILLESLYTGLICLSNNISGTTGLSSKFSNSSKK